jgi:hypothetical protein
MERSARARQTSPESVAAAGTGFVPRAAAKPPRMSAAPGAAPAAGAAAQTPNVSSESLDHSQQSR